MRQHIEANNIKDRLGRHGFLFTMSLYGVIVNPETKRPEYRRIEVFMKSLPSEIDVGGIKNFFRDLVPLSYYSIWAYNNQVQEIVQVESWL